MGTPRPSPWRLRLLLLAASTCGCALFAGEDEGGDEGGTDPGDPEITAQCNSVVLETGGDGMAAPGEMNEEFARADGNTTTFRLVPINVQAVYRFTELDDRFRVPIIPYGKFGLAYYRWWSTAPNGDKSEFGEAGCDPNADGCSTETASDGSFGVVATVGLAFRAERLDPGAANSLRNELGIEHAGIYAELVYAAVDGFGADSQLNVGDLTWFAGINFEF